ncbi:MAG: MYXO-CTERM sorting domain-containing protein [Myxococcales bacterium]
MTVIFSRRHWLGCALSALSVTLAAPLQAADLSWKGFDWDVTNGGMAGVADGAATNVSVDANGWLHLRITKNGNTWTASELFTTQKLGFGTYQWQIEGPIDTFDKNNVLGLFPYGPAAGIGSDGTNEIDIEFSRWGIANAPNADFTDYPASGNVIGETTFTFSLGGSTSATARFTWNATSIESSVLKGHQAMASDTGLLKKWKYAPNNPSVNIPQQALPLGINLWCFDAPPSDGQNVEIVLRDFQFVKEGDPLPGGGGTGAGGAANGAGGAANGGGNSGGAGGTAHGGASSGGSAGVSAQGGGSGGGVAVAGGGSGEPNSGGNATSGASAGGAGAPGSSGGSTTPSAGGATSGGSATIAGGSTSTGNVDDTTTSGDSSSGCGCHVIGAARSPAGWSGVWAFSLLALRRRKRSRAQLRALQAGPHPKQAELEPPYAPK